MLIHVGYPKTGSTWIQQRVIDNDDCAVGSVAPWTAVPTTIIEPLPLWYDDPPSRDRFPVFDHRYLEFDRLALRYQELFGTERVHVLLFEDLVADPLRFASAVLALAGAAPIDHLDESPERRGLGGVGLSLRGSANAIFGRDRNNRVARFHVPGVAKAIESIDAHAPDSVQARVAERHRRLIADRVGERYRASNQRLAERFALDLAAKGYDT